MKALRLRKPKDSGTETLERLERWPSLRSRWAGKRVRIWSGQWSAYWRPGGAGYTTDGLEAGLYQFEEAFRNTRHCGPEKRIEYRLVNAQLSGPSGAASGSA